MLDRYVFSLIHLILFSLMMNNLNVKKISEIRRFMLFPRPPFTDVGK
jgi:hypothetical protein